MGPDQAVKANPPRVVCRGPKRNAHSRPWFDVVGDGANVGWRVASNGRFLRGTPPWVPEVIIAVASEAEVVV